MKPIRLIIEAFGPYKDKVEIDFTKLYQSGLYVISGKTGSGKSTIFDAISFALYGEGSVGNERRTPGSFRSQYATTELTSVTLYFSHKNKEYRVYRMPAQERNKVKGSGVTKQSAYCEFEDLQTKEVLTKLSEVDNKIFSIIGLTKNQFSQTCMIAQGDFLKILLSKSNDRKALFQKIFNTEIYSSFQNELKNKWTKTTQNFKLICSNIKNEYNNIVFYDENQKTMDLSSEYNIDEVISYLENDISNLESLNDNISKDIKQLNETITCKKLDIANIKNNNDNLKSLCLRKESLSKLEQDRDKISELEKLTTLAISLLQVETLENSVSMNTKELLKKTNNRKSYQEKLNDCKSQLLDLEESYVLAKQKNDNVTIQLNEVNTLNSLLSDCKKRDSILKDNKSFEKNIDNLSDIINQFNDELIRLKKLYFSNQATLLASNLEEGMPCPVCGSVNHPSLACSSSNDVIYDDIEDLEEKINKENDTIQSYKAKLVSNNELLNQIYSNLDGSLLSRDISIVDLNNNIIEKNNEINSIIKNYNNLSKKYESLNANIKSYSDLIERLDIEIKELSVSLKESEESFKNALKENSITESEYQSKKLPASTIKANQDKISKYNSEVSKVKSSIKTLEDSLIGKEIVDVSELENEVNLFVEKHNSLTAKEKKIYSALNINKRIYSSLGKLNNEFNKTRSELSLIDSLYNTVSGQVSEKVKIQFETYVQQYYFRQVIAEANVRLHDLTNGIFSLRLKEESSQTRSQTGLDLEVYDANSGKYREVGSLSGGESFITSLSLALGLSDIVSRNSGQIRIESMFIDEGFGTLDKDTLDLAIKTLAKLAGNDNLVGVISHVEELKSRIEAKIEVTKTNKGSKCEIIV